jgi:hypothetical protein
MDTTVVKVATVSDVVGNVGTLLSAVLQGITSQLEVDPVIEVPEL